MLISCFVKLIIEFRRGIGMKFYNDIFGMYYKIYYSLLSFDIPL